MPSRSHKRGLTSLHTDLKVKEEQDLAVDFLFSDVDGALPELYQIVEVVFMGNSMDQSSESGTEVGWVVHYGEACHTIVAR